mmetsp:Transcript_249/g.312  ORF Transcript_249/g.312 Transcript_249/m.312 type:complete len:217 (+) Transcript_249:1-651(+)
MAKEDYLSRECELMEVKARVEVMKKDFESVKKGPEGDSDEDDKDEEEDGPKIEDNKSCADVIVPALAAGCKAVESTPISALQQGPETADPTASSLRPVSTKGMSRKQLAKMRRLKAQNAMEEANMSYQDQMRVALETLRVQSQAIKEETHRRQVARRLHRKYVLKAQQKSIYKLLYDLKKWKVNTDNLFEEEQLQEAWAVQAIKRKNMSKSVSFEK